MKVIGISVKVEKDEKIVNCYRCPVSGLCTWADTIAGYVLTWGKPTENTAASAWKDYEKALGILKEITPKCPLIKLIERRWSSPSRKVFV